MITELKVEDEPSIVFATRVIWSRGCRPVRVVLRKLEEGSYVTHKETLGLDGDTFRHEAFHHGNYFQKFPVRDDELSYREALADFNERAGNL